MFKPIGYALIIAITLGGCGKTKKNAASPAMQALVGHVQDRNAAAISTAKLTYVDKSATARTDDQGAFNLSLPRGTANDAVLTIEAPGYVTRTVRLSLPASGPPDDTIFALREIDVAHTITVPAAGEPPVTIAASRVDGGATLSIPPGSLTDASGRPVTGNADISFTYFHPKETPDKFPVGLFALNANTGTIEQLKTFGMIDVEISQQGNLLSVAPGSALGLNFKVPTALQAVASDPNSGPNYRPKLFSANTTTGLWDFEADLDTEDLYFDANVGEYVAKLRHMSSWNLDSTVGTGVMSCIRGSVEMKYADGSTRLVANEPAKVWFADRDQVVMYDVVTDGGGQYCHDVAMRADGLNAEVNYFVTGSRGADDGSMCNPLPAFCSKCRQNNGDFFCTFCGLRSDDICDYGQKWGNGDILFDNRSDGRPNGCRPRTVCTTASSESDLKSRCEGGPTTACLYQETCNPPSRVAVLKPGPRCATNINGCTVLDTVIIDRSGNPPPKNAPPSTPPATPTTPTTPTKPKPETVVCDPANPRTKVKGQACVPNIDQCCPLADGLICSDYVCVPPLK